MRENLPIKNPTFKSVAVLRGEIALFELDRHATFHSLMKFCQKLQITDSKWLNSLLWEWETLFKIDENYKKSLEQVSFDEMWTTISFMRNKSNEITFPKSFVTFQLTSELFRIPMPKLNVHFPSFPMQRQSKEMH